MPRILVAGDTCPIGRNELLFRRGDSRALLGDLEPEFRAADLVIANLECPLIESASPITKCGPNLGAPIDCARGLKAMGIDVVSLANNHIMDHGPEGLQATICALEHIGIAHVGAGESIESARRILMREVGGLRIGILALAEHEFCIADDLQPGANPIDVIDFVRNVNEIGSNIDCLIVLVHGGNEYYPYPRPGLLKTCRFLVEQGANAVICSHSHCIGCMETYLGAPIVYGQGNFLFDWPSTYATFHEGLLISLAVSQDSRVTVQPIACRQSDHWPGARKMMADEETALLSSFFARSRAISDPAFVRSQWREFCKTREHVYMTFTDGLTAIFNRFARIFGLPLLKDSEKSRYRRLNFLRCESHREALVTLLTTSVDIRR